MVGGRPNSTNVNKILQGNSPATKFYMPTFRNTLFHLHRQVGIPSYLPAYEDGTVCSETSAYKIRSPGNYPEESIQHSERGQSLKSRKCYNYKPQMKFLNHTNDGNFLPNDSSAYGEDAMKTNYYSVMNNSFSIKTKL